MTQFFGTDGVRGLVGEWPMTPEFALRLGQAAGHVLNANDRNVTVVVGRDTRLSGPLLHNALTAGLLASGVDVVDAQVIPTAGVAWLVRRMGAQAGVVISASHNPVDQNGVKFFSSSGQKLPNAVEEEIERLLLDELDGKPAPFPVSARLGRLINGLDLQELYLQALLKEHPDHFLEKISLVIDCANGAASHLAPLLFARAGARVVSLNASPTGLNINTRAGSEHVRRQPAELGEFIRQNQADFGLAFDGDADRVVFVDQDGNLIDGDHMLGFLGRYLLGKDQLLANAVVTTNMRNTGLKRYLEGLGLQMYETPVGDKYVVEKLLELRAHQPATGKFGLGGEQAGHIILIDDLYTTGCGLRTALYVMRAYLESGITSMTQFAEGVGKTPQIIASAKIGRGPRLDKTHLAALEQDALQNNQGLARISLRYSGTEPLFRAMLESFGDPSEQELARLAVSICRPIQALAGLGDAPIDILNVTRGGVMSI